MQFIVLIRDVLIDFTSSIISLIRIPFFCRYRGLSINRKSLQTLFILSNGPSLELSIEKYKDKLNNLDLLGLNMFAIDPYYILLRPKYYVVVSPDMWEDNSDIRLLEKRKRLWKAINTNTSWSMDLYLPSEAKNNSAWKKYLTNDLISIRYFNRTPIEGFRFFKNILFRYGLGMPRPHNVLIPSLMIGINMGYNIIVLLGADHSWLPELSVNDNNEVLVCQKHFYDQNTAKPAVMGKRGGTRKLHEILHKWQLSFQAYFEINEYAKSQKTKIYNATPNSFIDAFERIDLDYNSVILSASSRSKSV
jgi:hypothetical protein